VGEERPNTSFHAESFGKKGLKGGAKHTDQGPELTRPRAKGSSATRKTRQSALVSFNRGREEKKAFSLPAEFLTLQ